MRVYKYGIKSITGFNKIMQYEMHRMTAHWNALVDLEYERRREFRLACVECLPDYKAAHDRLETIKPDIDALFVEIKQYRIVNRTKTLEGELKNRADALLGERKMLFATMKSAAKALPKDISHAIEKQFWRKAAFAYAASGCYWPNKDQTAQDFGAARQKAMQDKGSLHNREFDETGRFTQRLKTAGGCTVKEFLAGNSKGAWATSEVRDLDNKRPVLDMAFTGFVSRDENGKRHPDLMSLEVIYHRPLPEDGVIKKIQLVRKKHKSKLGAYVWTVCFTVEMADKARHDKANVCGINLNFRKVGDTLRVATVVDDKGKHTHYYLPADIVRRFQVAEELHGKADDAWNTFESYLKSLPNQERFADIMGKRRVDLATCWRVLDDWGHTDDPANSQAVNFFKVYHRYYLSYTGCRRRAGAYRDKLYEGYAKEIAENFAYLCVNDTPLAQLNRVKDKDGLTIDNELADLPRKQRVMAGLYTLKEWLAKQARKNGGLVEVVKAKVTHTCSSCGTEADKKLVDIRWVCKQCQTVHDIDINAAINNMKFALGTAEKKANSAKWKKIKASKEEMNQGLL